MKARRFLQFSLRGFLIFVTVFLVWLGWKVERARRQCEAVKAIEAIGGIVQYDYQGEPDTWTQQSQLRSFPYDLQPNVATCLKTVFGIDFFQDVESVSFNSWCGPVQKMWGTGIIESNGDRPASEDAIKAAIPHLKRLPSVYLEEPEHIFGGHPTNDALKSELNTALPYCRIVRDNVYTSVKLMYKPRPPEPDK